MISGRTATYGLVGWPVEHSLSPAMQNAAFAHLGLDAAYLCFPVAPERLEEALRGAHALQVRGLNVTIPHKQQATGACVRLDPVAAAVGAANTLRRVEDGWEGHNTDATALRELLAEAGVEEGQRVLLAGAGGAARAAAWAALRLGTSLRVAARREEEARGLCAALAGAGRGGAAPAAWGELGAEAAAADVVINGTSVGLKDREARLPGLRLRPGQVALDVVYGDTAFARDAAAAGARLVRGEEMLVRQGAHALGVWTGLAAPVEVMAAALRRAREARTT